MVTSRLITRAQGFRASVEFRRGDLPASPILDRAVEQYHAKVLDKREKWDASLFPASTVASIEPPEIGKRPKETHGMPAKHGDIIDAPTLDETLRRMRAKLGRVVPDAEIALKAELAFQINQLKAERNAVILGHNYMEPALFHSVADYVGDSLELSRISTETDADVIIFCGVQFMAETAKVLNPEKTVLIPAEKAGCSLAEGITPDDVLALKAIYPGAPVVTYVNTYASVKAVSDYCCTSGNAAAVIRYLRQKWDASLFPASSVASRARKASARVIEPPEIGKRPNFCVVFIPDEYLARNTARDLGLEYVAAPNPLDGAPEFAGVAHGQPSVIGWRSRCEVHELYTVQDVDNARKQWPDVVILAHPECHPDVIAKVDFVGSTKAMIDYVRNVDSPRYLLLTECSMGDNVAAEFPHREMVRACSLRCKHMNLITLEQTLASLEKLQYAVELPDDIIQNARLPIERMLAIR